MSRENTIRQIAQRIYKERIENCFIGDELSDWLQAEMEYIKIDSCFQKNWSICKILFQIEKEKWG